MSRAADEPPQQTSPDLGFRGRLLAMRARVRGIPGGFLIWRIGITIAGVLVIAVGVVLLPLPGPGWVIIFAGLGLLATEYTWAANLLRRMRDLLREWTAWTARQSRPVQVAIGAAGLLLLAGIAVGGWLLYRST
jgi:uncharacterized protein (TIGR02611 family)